MRTPFSLLVGLSLAAAVLAALAPAEASAAVCTSLRDSACDATLCYYDRLAGQWECYFPIDWECLVWRPCWYPALP